MRCTGRASCRRIRARASGEVCHERDVRGSHPRGSVDERSRAGLLEALHLRNEDADLVRRQLTIRSGKGDEDRFAQLPESMEEKLRSRTTACRGNTVAISNNGPVILSCRTLSRARALQRPARPSSYGVFPATPQYRERTIGKPCGHDLHETVVQRAVREPVRTIGATRRTTCHALRLSFATHLLESGSDPDPPEAPGSQERQHDHDPYPRPDRGPQGVRNLLDSLR